MPKLHQLAFAAVAAIGLSGPATAEEPAQAPRHSCAFVNQIYNFKDVDDYNAIVWTSPRKAYHVTFFNSCREMKWAFFARVEARPGICLSRGDKIVVGRHGFADHCIIDKIEPLPPKGEGEHPAAY